MDFETTKGAGVDRLKVLVYGESGAGKTTLAGTTGDDAHTLIVSAESGLLPLRGRDIRVKRIEQWEEVRDVWDFLRRGDHDFRWVIIDSLSEIGEQCLTWAKRVHKDGRQAYGEIIDRMTGLVKAWRDLPLHVVMTCKQERLNDDGRLVYGPQMPGSKLGPALPYLFDEVFALRVKRNDEGEPVRWLQTDDDGQYTAKDRGGALAMFEPPSLQHIHSKIAGVAPQED